MSQATTGTNIWANSSLISYSGSWNLSSYVPLSAGATASIRYLGGGVAWLGAGVLGTWSGDGGITTQIDAGSKTARNWTILGSSVDDPTQATQQIPLPFGRHTADFIFDGQQRNFTFAGFQMSTNLTLPDDVSSIDMNFYAAEPVPADQVQYYGEPTTQAGWWTPWNPNSTVTYVEGPDTGFAFNISGVGLTVYGAPNATADVDYSVYFNMTDPPPASSDIAPFANYTQKAGTGGVIFYVGAMPAGNTRVLFVNKGDTPLGFERALVHWPGNYTWGLKNVCYVNCNEQQQQQLAGTQFGAGSKRGLSWAVVGLALASALGTLMV